MKIIRILKAEQELNLNGQKYTISDIINSIEADIKNIIEENDLQIEIDAIELIGLYERRKCLWK